LTSRRLFELGLEKLPPLAADERLRTAQKGAFDAAHRALWIPVATDELTTPAGCSFFTCDQPTGVTRDQYLYRVDVDAVAATAPQVTDVEQPQAVVAGGQLTVTLHTTLTEPIDATASELRLYLADGAVPAT